MYMNSFLLGRVAREFLREFFLLEEITNPRPARAGPLEGTIAT